MDIHQTKDTLGHLTDAHGSENKVAGFYPDGVTLERAAAQLETQGVGREQMSVITPDDEFPADKVETDSKAVKQDMWKFHLAAGVTGLGAGIVLAALLTMLGPSLFSSSPLMTFIILTNVGFLGGLMVGGFIALRPDQDVLIDRVRKSNSEKRWTLVVRTASAKQREKVQIFLRASAQSVSSTI